MNNKKIIYNNTGFSLIEILISLVIISVGLLGVASMSSNVVMSNDISGNTAEAVMLAQDKLEELLNMNFSDSQLTGGSHTNYDGSEGIVNPINPDGTVSGIYTRTWTVTDNAASSTLKSITVSVTWTDSSGPHTVSAATIKI